MDADKFEKVLIGCEDALWEWLEENAAQDESVWLVTFKKAMGPGYVSREQVLDALVAHGWIDGRRKSLDEARTMQLVGPRRTPLWAESYCARAERLMAEGRMHPLGQKAVHKAKAEGHWRSLPDVDALELPDDLAAALSEDARAAEWWDRAAPSYRRNVLRWVATAERQETREGRIMSVVEASQQGERLRHL